MSRRQSRSDTGKCFKIQGDSQRMRLKRRPETHKTHIDMATKKISLQLQRILNIRKTKSINSGQSSLKSHPL